MSKSPSLQEDNFEKPTGVSTEVNAELAEILSWSDEERAVREKALLRKMDLRLVPWMT